MSHKFEVTTSDGKYAVVQKDPSGPFCVLRHGKPWIESLALVPGGNAMLDLAFDLEEARKEIANLKRRIEEITRPAGGPVQ